MKNKNTKTPHEKTSLTPSPPTFPSNPSYRPNATLIFTIFALGITLSAFIQRFICQNHQSLSQTVFGFSTLANPEQRLTVLKQSMLYMAILQFFIVFVIMNLRIIGQKISPTAQKDPLSISLLNRILSNNIEQSFVFFGLYAYLLVGNDVELEQKYALSLPLIFLIGRVCFALGYILGTVTGIPTFRSFGFAFSVFVNSFMILELILNISDIYRVFLFGQ